MYVGRVLLRSTSLAFLSETDRNKTDTDTDVFRTNCRSVMNDSETDTDTKRIQIQTYFGQNVKSKAYF